MIILEVTVNLAAFFCFDQSDFSCKIYLRQKKR